MIRDQLIAAHPASVAPPVEIVQHMLGFYADSNLTHVLEPNMWRTLLVATIYFTLISLTGCTIGSELGERVGNSCRDDLDCAPGSECLRGGDFPDGMCSHDCNDDRDCPEYARCIDTQGGVCLLACDTDGDCPSRYECKSRDREGHGGRANICLGD